jgi:XTP/dITP diphosphohydrolase
MREFVLAAATGNLHKLREIQETLGPLGARVLTAARAGVPADFAPVENGSTFEQNSHIKAAALMDVLARETPPPGGAVIDGVIADDSGLCVDALGGAPGVYSARFADRPYAAAGDGRGSGLSGIASGDDADARNTAKLLDLLGDLPYERRTARFVCVVTLILRGPGAAEIVCRGECEGHIAYEPRGAFGFGYDPVFVPLTEERAPGVVARTFAELSPREKNTISHRALALAKLHEAFSKARV